MRLLRGSGALELQLRSHAHGTEGVVRFFEAGGGGDRVSERSHGLDRLAGVEEEGEGPERGELDSAPAAADRGRAPFAARTADRLNARLGGDGGGRRLHQLARARG